MKALLISLLLFFTGFGQSPFEQVLKEVEKKSDTDKIKTINDYCLKIRGSNPELAIELGEYSLVLAQKISNSHYQAESNNLIGVIVRNTGDYNNALPYHLRALKIAEDAGDSIQIGFSYNNIGVIYRQRYNLIVATEYIIKGLQVFEKINHLDGLAFSNLTMGTIYVLQKNYKRALTHYRYALNIREVQNNIDEKARTLDHIAGVYLLLGRNDEALQSYLSLEKIYKSNNNKRGLGDCWIGIGKIYAIEKKDVKAAPYFSKALSSFRQLGYKEEIIIACQNLGLTNAKLKNTAAAYPYIKEALRLSHELNSPRLISESLLFAAEYYEIIYQLDSALVYLKSHQALKDSINEAENFSRLVGIETLYQTEKQERENRILTQDIEGQKKQKYLLFIITLLVFVLAFVFVLRNKTLKKINAELRELHAMKDTFFRIIAHDLRAPFNAIFGFTDLLLEDYKSLSEAEKLDFIEHIATASKQSYQLLENLLLWARTNTGRIEFTPQKYQLKELVDETLQLLSPTASSKNIQLISEVPGAVYVTADADMLKTVLRNLLSNSIKFSNEEEGIIKVAANVLANNVVIEISDNGIGMHEKVRENLFRIDKTKTTLGTKGEKGTGLGLLLCKEFIDKHSGKISVESKVNEGTKFIISLPQPVSISD